jgi:hypothetical protein
MKPFDAFFLPDLQSDVEYRVSEAGSSLIRWPLLNAEQLNEICARITENRQRHLADLPVARIVEAIDTASRSMFDHIEETSLLISNTTGYSVATVKETLGHMFNDWRADALNEMLRAELTDPNVLDHPVPDKNVDGKRVAAYGYPLCFHVFSGNVPGVAVTSLVRSLLVKSASLGKTASGEPLLPIAFARALQKAAPDIASCVALTYWPGEMTDLTATAANAADAIIVYGGTTAVDAIRSQVRADKHLVVHGPRLSFGIVGARVNARDATHVARSVAAYDQQGCVSPHLVYVNGDADTARAFARAVGDQLEQVGREWPRGRVGAEEAVAIRNARTAAEFGSKGTAEVYGAENAGYSVIFEADPAFRLSCLNRVLYVKPLPAMSDLAGLLPRGDVLQSVAVAGLEEKEQAELIRLLGLAGVSRVTSFEKLPWPPMHWHHDGSAPIRELLRWQDIEA